MSNNLYYKIEDVEALAKIRVGGVIFREGVTWKMAIDCAKRHYIEHAENKESATEPMISIQDQLKVFSGEYVLVPKEPTEAMYGGFARDLVRYLELNKRWSPLSLDKHLNRFHGSSNTPNWLSKEIPDFSSDHHFAKGDIAVLIYKAMIEALEVK